MPSSSKMGRALRGPLIHASILALASAGALAQQAPAVLDVAGGNSASNEVLWLDFDNGLAVALNNDANRRASLRSFEFFKNTCRVRLDLVTADTNRGEVLLYPSGRGTSSLVCGGAGCPSRPDGLSSSDAGLLSVADTGTAGTTPTVWLFEPAACGGPSVFNAPRNGGQFRVGTHGPATPVIGISDTEFVSVLGGGLAQGDLLVLTSGPTTLSLVRATDIAALLAGSINALPSSRILVDQDFFGAETPTAMAFVPGTGGIGSSIDGVSQSEDLLVTLTGGRVLKLIFQTDGNSIFLAPPDATVPGQSALQNRVFLASGLGNGPLGIDAGTREAETFMVVADRQQGSFLRYLLNVDGDGRLSLARHPNGTPVFTTIRSGVQNPQGVTINSDAYAASDCVDVEGTADQTGCRVRKTLELHYTQGEDTPFAVTDTVLANISFIEDTRGNGGGTLPLPGGFKVPASCRGIPLPDDPTSSVIVLVEITKNFDITPGNFVQSKELVDQIIPQLGTCKEVGTRVFYHPSKNALDQFDTPENGTLYDTTFFCSNPSRSLERDNSPLVICADPLYLQALAANSGVKGRLAKDYQTEIGLRAENLRVVVNGLAGTTFDALRTLLNGHIDAALQDVKRKAFVDASADFDAGVLAVYQAKAAIAGSGLPATYYGDLLGRFLALAFYSKESAGQMDYCPQDPVRTEELVDVDCTP